MEWWIRVVSPMKRVWIRVAARIKIRKSVQGLGQLRREVSTCEYEDVHVMWEMLKKNDAGIRLRGWKQQHVWGVLDSLCSAF